MDINMIIKENRFYIYIPGGPCDPGKPLKIKEKYTTII